MPNNCDANRLNRTNSHARPTWKTRYARGLNRPTKFMPGRRDTKVFNRLTGSLKLAPKTCDPKGSRE